MKTFVHLGLDSGDAWCRFPSEGVVVELGMVYSGLPMLFLGNVVLCWSIVPGSALLEDFLTTLYRLAVYCGLYFIYKAGREIKYP